MKIDFNLEIKAKHHIKHIKQLHPVIICFCETVLSNLIVNLHEYRKEFQKN